MGPVSREAVLEVLGNLLAEARLQRGTLSRLESKINARLDHEAQGVQQDFAACNRRVSVIEAKLREHGIPLEAPIPTPAE